MAKEETKAKKEKKNYWKEFKAELKKVIWPTPKQIVNNTVAVIVIVLLTATIVLALDLIFEVITTKGINSIKNALKTEEIEETNNAEENNDVITEDVEETDLKQENPEQEDIVEEDNVT